MFRSPVFAASFKPLKMLAGGCPSDGANAAEVHTDNFQAHVPDGVCIVDLLVRLSPYRCTLMPHGTTYSIPTARFRPTTAVMPALFEHSRQATCSWPDDHNSTSLLLIDTSHQFRKLATAKRRAQMQAVLLPYVLRGISHDAGSSLLATTCQSRIPVDQNSILILPQRRSLLLCIVLRS